MSRKDELRQEIEKQKQYLKEQTDLTKGILDRSLQAIRDDIKKLQEELRQIVQKEDENE